MNFNRMDPIIVLLVGLVTCGLFLIYWNYKTAEDINRLTGKEQISPMIAALCGFCFPANVYFYYVVGRALPECGAKAQLKLEDKSTILLIFGFLLPIVSAMIAQGELNRCYDVVAPK